MQDKNQCRDCAVNQGTHKPAEATHHISEPTFNRTQQDRISELEEMLRKEVQHS